MIELSRHIVGESIPSIRLLDFVIAHIPEVISRNGAKKAIKKGAITLDSAIVESGRFVRKGQLIIHWDLEETKKVFPLKLDVLFEDENLAIVFKPPGIGTSGNYFRTLENALPFNLNFSAEQGGLKYPKPVHRLDNPTSGLLVVAKTQVTRVALGKLFEKGEVQKEYHAIVHGKLEDDGKITDPIDGKEALSVYESIAVYTSKKFGHLSLLKLSPHTGRTHQLRIHLAQKGFPIIGDTQYSPKETLHRGKGLFLSSTGIRFIHPITFEETKCEVALPNKFNTFLKRFDQ